MREAFREHHLGNGLDELVGESDDDRGNDERDTAPHPAAGEVGDGSDTDNKTARKETRNSRGDQFEKEVSDERTSVDSSPPLLEALIWAAHPKVDCLRVELVIARIYVDHRGAGGQDARCDEGAPHDEARCNPDRQRQGEPRHHRPADFRYERAQPRHDVQYPGRGRLKFWTDTDEPGEAQHARERDQGDTADHCEHRDNPPAQLTSMNGRMAMQLTIERVATHPASSVVSCGYPGSGKAYLPEISDKNNHAGYFWLTEVGSRITLVWMHDSPAPTTWEQYARELGIELQRRRIAAGLTQEDLAHKSGLTRTHYQQVERGYWKKNEPANPSVKLLARVAQVLEIEIGDLLPSAESLEWAD